MRNDEPSQQAIREGLPQPGAESPQSPRISWSTATTFCAVNMLAVLIGSLPLVVAWRTLSPMAVTFIPAVVVASLIHVRGDFAAIGVLLLGAHFLMLISIAMHRARYRWIMTGILLFMSLGHSILALYLLGGIRC
jgi:hypothetical protein